MSYAPIYAKLRDLEERLIKIETLPPAISLPVVPVVPDVPIVPVVPVVPDVESIAHTDLIKLLNECALNSSSISQLSSRIAMLATKEELPDVSGFATKSELATFSTKEELPDISGFATKEELVPLATKEELVPLATKEELVPLATKEELVPLATKEELVPKDDLTALLAKFDNIIDVVAQLNSRIDELYTKIPISA